MDRKRLTLKKVRPVFAMTNNEISKKISKIIHWAIGLVIFCIAIFFWSCTPKIVTITEYKEVKIPVKCNFEMPKKPEPIKNAVEMNLLILKYVEELEVTLRSCL